jgi:hypothetical protein
LADIGGVVMHTSARRGASLIRARTTGTATTGRQVLRSDVPGLTVTNGGNTGLVLPVSGLRPPVSAAVRLRVRPVASDGSARKASRVAPDPPRTPRAVGAVRSESVRPERRCVFGGR